MYVITKRSRAPREFSYTGPAWIDAELEHRYRKTYKRKSTAINLAKALSKANPVGFSVYEVLQDSKHFLFFKKVF